MAYLKKQKHKRHLFDRYYHILDAAKDGMRKTPLMSEAKIPWPMLSEYLVMLKKLGLIEKIGDLYRDQVFYVTTDEGLEFMKRFKSLKKMIL